ncbi:RNA recognition motif domain-containing protein [Vibrio gallicus]|uniref:RNA recognition motif domain-containing protein n=1 Tax=Vibrio gallicus TaxID=190897 RepID=UPI0021C32E0F|nr:RNA-binding protein [Vibrio gallicus]
MNPKKSQLLILVLLVLGFILFTFLGGSANIAFAIGVALTALVLWPRSTEEYEQETDLAPTTGTTLYVGNLSYKANEADVKSLFEQHGHVNGVRLMKDKRTGKRRGFGFVEVSEESVDAMISALNESEYMQRTIKVRVANEPKHPAEDGS